uniref:Sushi domain-containing protein n=1 Tax=Gouania willdenowi TaxID=441366 RepID=A0A8C5I1Y4_GOUWI
VGFVLLVRFAVLEHNVACLSTAQFCNPSNLNHGYFVPVKATNQHGANLTYACEEGHKPVAKGWWTRVTCQGERWSPVVCVEVKMHAFPPTVANGTYRKNLNGWYEVNNVISITCNKGYEHTGQYSTAKCLGGVWSSLPSCQQLIHSLFAVDSNVQYKCQRGYTAVGGHTTASVTCRDGQWTRRPSCSKRTITTVTENDGSTTGTGESVTPSSGVGLNRCGEKPIITNGVIVQTGSDYLKYACPLYYKLEGSDTVRCLNNGLWTPLPFCREAFCHVNTEDYPFLINIQAEFLLEGEKKRFKCVEKFVWSSTYSEFECMNGISFLFDGCFIATRE